MMNRLSALATQVVIITSGTYILSGNKEKSQILCEKKENTRENLTQIYKQHFNVNDLKLEELKKEYLKNGYVVVQNVLNANEIKDIRHKGDELAEKLIERKDENSSDKRGKTDIMRIMHPHRESDFFLQLACMPSMVKILESLIPAHFSFPSTGIKFFQSMYFLKPLSFAGVNLHQDEHYLPTRDRSLTAIWIPLVDVDERNGCLWVVPESHASGTLQGVGENGAITDNLRTSIIPVKMEAGDLLIFNGYLIHGSISSQGEDSFKQRPAFTAHYCSSSSPLHTIPGQDFQCDMRKYHVISGVDPYQSSRGPPIQEGLISHLGFVSTKTK